MVSKSKPSSSPYPHRKEYRSSLAASLVSSSSESESRSISSMSIAPSSTFSSSDAFLATRSAFSRASHWTCSVSAPSAATVETTYFISGCGTFTASAFICVAPHSDAYVSSVQGTRPVWPFLVTSAPNAAVNAALSFGHDASTALRTFAAYSSASSAFDGARSHTGLEQRCATPACASGSPASATARILAPRRRHRRSARGTPPTESTKVFHFPSALSRIVATGCVAHVEQQKAPFFLTNMRSRRRVGCHSDSGSASASRPFTGGGGSESFSASVPDPFLLPDLGLGLGAAAERDCARALSRVLSCVVSVPVNALRMRRGTGPGDGSVVRFAGGQIDRRRSDGFCFGTPPPLFSGVSRPDGRRGTTAATRGFETAQPTPRRDRDRAGWDTHPHVVHVSIVAGGTSRASSIAASESSADGRSASGESRMTTSPSWRSTSAKTPLPLRGSSHARVCTTAVSPRALAKSRSMAVDARRRRFRRGEVGHFFLGPRLSPPRARSARQHGQPCPVSSPRRLRSANSLLVRAPLRGDGVDLG